jgi:secreted trypsin-like serine protease
MMGTVTRLLRRWLALALCSGLGAAMLAVPGAARGATQPRVVDGAPASISQWPFIAALVTHGVDAVDGQFCGGSVIAPTVVLTAAHCVEGSGPGDIDVVTGLARLNDDGAGQRIAVVATSVDPGYDPNTQRHDAALLVLAQPTSAPPISIAANDRGLIVPGAPLAVAGWGDIDSAGDAPNVLHAGALKAIATRVLRAGVGLRRNRHPPVLCALPPRSQD